MSKRQLTILYGSQTGCAQDLAEKIYRESKRWHFSGPVQALDAYDVQRLVDERLVVFVCSTQGQGNEPDNMLSFWRFLLRKSLPADSLCNLHFGVLGLGDSGYAKFNFVAKRLSKRLQQLGAVPILATGLCDDQHDLGTSAVATPWTAELWDRLQRICPLPNGLEKLSETTRPFKWSISVSSRDSLPDRDNQLKDIYENCVDAVFDRPFMATVLSNTRTTSETHFQDVRLIGLGVDDVAWCPGDVLLVRPRNAPDKVAELFELFAEHGLDLYEDTVVQIRQFDDEMPVPPHLQTPLTLSTIATQYWNLNVVPRPRAFELLALHSTNDLEREKLIEFTTPEGQQDLFSYANRPRRTILEVLHEFPHSVRSLKLPVLFEIFEPIKPRSFSIASCRQSGCLDLLVAIVEYRTMLKTPRKGLCSNWLAGLHQGDRFRAVIKKGTMKLPKESERTLPIVMVGPGTGLAPFRSILQEAQWRRSEGVESGRMALFFGSRNRRGDFHCEQELCAMEESGMLKLFTAFSRDQEEKIYVQHRIKEQAAILRQMLITQPGLFLVSGNSKNMPLAVREALAEALDDQQFVDELIRTGRYQEETWG